jgi:hypothetical protein
MLDRTSTPAAELLAKLNVAVAAVNDAQGEVVSRSKAVGVLLLEAKRLHPVVKDFEAFLKRVDGLHLSRAYDFMRLAGGRTTDEELKKDARERQQKARDKKKRPKPEPKKPEPFRDVTETAEEAERKPGPKAEPKADSVTGADVTERRKPDSGSSARAFAEFRFACQQYLPKMTEADQRRARALVEGFIAKAEAA